jgi:RNA polymerase sigma factor for flagellar operon FliA
VRDLSLYRENDQQHASEVLQSHAPLVKQVALHLIARMPASVELDDLIQVGMIGLLEADKNFDASKGAQFETFARIRVRGAMIDEVRRYSNLPRSVMTSIRDISTSRSELEQKLGRVAQDAELAEYMGLSLEEFHQNLGKNHDYQTVSITESDDDDQSNGDMELRFDGLSMTDQISDDEFRHALAEEIGNLTEREQLIFSLYYNEEMNLKEIALVVGVTESRVCQIQRQSVKKLKTALEVHI